MRDVLGFVAFLAAIGVFLTGLAKLLIAIGAGNALPWFAAAIYLYIIGAVLLDD